MRGVYKRFYHEYYVPYISIQLFWCQNLFFFKFEIYEWFCALTLYKDLYGLILDLVIVWYGYN